MDHSVKLKYQKYKLKVKIWEDEFMQNHGRLPSRSDIKEAATTVRHAYKSYWSLKSEVTNLSKLDDNSAKTATIEEKSDPEPKSTTRKISLNIDNSKDFNKAPSDLIKSVSVRLDFDSEEKSGVIFKSKNQLNNQRDSLGLGDKTIKVATQEKTTKEIIPVFTHAKNFAENSEIRGVIRSDSKAASNSNTENTASKKNSESTKISPQINNKDDGESLEIKNVKGVWGSHLNKTPVIPKATTKLLERSSSFTQKLFGSSTFKSKRNPLKPLVPLRRTQSECFPLTSESKCDSPSLSSIPLTPDVQPPSPDLFAQDDEYIPSPLETQTTEEVSTPATLQLFSSTMCKVVVKDSTKTHNKTLGGSKLKMAETSHKLDMGWLARCTSPSVEASPAPVKPKKMLTVSNASRSTPKIPTEPKNKTVVPSGVSSGDPLSNTNLSSVPNLPPVVLVQPCSALVQPEEFSDDEVCSDSETETLPLKARLMQSKRFKRTASESALPSPPPAVKKQKLDKTSNASKIEALEKKISSGRVNENFVKINIKKKVFVRGRKNTNYSKYKKNMWKKKGGGSSYSGGDSSSTKCFKCGEVGHWANKCSQAGLITTEEADEVDNSPFLTLEEADTLAQESKPLSRFAPMVENSDESKASGQQCAIPPRNLVLPLYERPFENEREEDENYLGETPLEVLKALRVFGHKSFRPGQEEAVMRILSGMSTLLMLSTGAGKSLCYQLPAYLYAQRRQPCITLVVSPLVSLMEDQVANLPGPLVGACLHMNQPPKQRELVTEQLRQGKLHVLLVSPEAVVQSEHKGGLGGLMRDLPPIAFACIDEAHCVSQWSHNFRPSYLMLCKVLRERLNVSTVLGLTATATGSTAASIAKHLGIPDGRVISDVPMPENLVLSVSRDANRDQALVGLLRGPRFSSCASIIIYAIRREECERVAGLLRTVLKDSEKRESTKRRALSWNAEPYHAGLTAFRRKQVQSAFMSGKLRIVVATVAFGMGINKNDLRAVIHYNMPSSFERFVQEVGRAGRDGLPAHCHLFLDCHGKDLNELRRHIYANSIDRHVIRKLLARVFKPCKCLRAMEDLEEWEKSVLESEAKNPSLPPPSESDDARDSVSDSLPPATNGENSKSTADFAVIHGCPGHEVAFLTEETVQALDIPEENILTLLCYLELHPRHWVEVLSPAYVVCKVSSYAGPGALRAASKKCPPLAMAVALDNKVGISHEKSSSIEFGVIDVASAIGWDSGQVKRQLKELEWRKEGGTNRRSPLVVQLSGIGLRVRARGTLPPEELDEALDWLHRRVEDQERSQLVQLESVFTSLTNISYTTYNECSEEADLKRCEQLRMSVRDYFGAEESQAAQPKLLPGVSSEDCVRADATAMVTTYTDTSFTGRAIARIFHGIASPCFPPNVWGRTRFWRLHLSDSFPALCRIATEEILRLRS